MCLAEDGSDVCSSSVLIAINCYNREHGVQVKTDLIREVLFFQCRHYATHQTCFSALAHPRTVASDDPKLLDG